MQTFHKAKFNECDESLMSKKATVNDRAAVNGCNLVTKVVTIFLIAVNLLT